MPTAIRFQSRVGAQALQTEQQPPAQGGTVEMFVARQAGEAVGKAHAGIYYVQHIEQADHTPALEHLRFSAVPGAAVPAALSTGQFNPAALFLSDAYVRLGG
ncbi:MAG: hypothetical protein GFH27_549291n289 [Chloroflexi bacterium AL-W]|nr:hypothetical protein [Chloroflexi bacterium AL-N1]NOK67243.1 hypothetical protein [Chloroflexi bacterium AL-N10]NOK75263.1 hypothetical protein [Chloroflexi bacterium AL-N5]NOK82051.1 hypothetical protein [Chloroflexi bacterium AL-W]NOK89896.1 hypothetical protein [Chloroflexi bacterium AL-N15]